MILLCLDFENDFVRILFVGGEECGFTVIGSEEAGLLVFATLCGKVREHEIVLTFDSSFFLRIILQIW